MNLGLKNKTILISASSGGIGLATATAFAAEGANVIINGRTSTAVRIAMQAVKKRYPESNLQGLIADLGTKTGCDQAIREIPFVDVLVNNIGIYEPVPFFEETDEDWYRLIEINIMSGIRLSRHFLQKMLLSDTGRVIFIASEVGLNPDPAMAHYSATKAMQLSISRSLAELTKGKRVTVNAVLPGPTATEGLVKFIQDVHINLPRAEAERKFISENRSSSLIQRLIEPKEIADAVVFLSSENAAAINGSILKVEGGIVKGN
jgi:3-oxoacyl-[acyl-carrier protein] reductase